MADQTNFEAPKPPQVSVDADSASVDGGFNRRIGLGLVLSVGANVLLLQGAGMMKNHMNVSPRTTPSGGVITVNRTKAAPTPSPVPTPEAKTTPEPTPAPTPTPRPVRKIEPTPLPKPVPDPVKPKPTPTPAVVKPITPPIAKPLPTVKPDVMPDKTPTPAMPAAAPTAIQTPAETPAVDTTPAAHDASPRANKQPAAVANPAENAAKILNATTPRENSPAADTKFVVDANQAAPARPVADLPRPSLVGQISAAIGSATSATAQPSSALNIATPAGERAPGQPRPFSSKTPIGPAGSGALTPRTSDAASNVSMANGGPIAPGSRSNAPQTSGPRSNGGAPMSPTAPTTLAPGAGPGVAISTPGMHGVGGPSGFHRPGHPIGGLSGAPSDRASGPGGGSFGGFNAGGGERNPINAATHGATPGSYNTGPGGDTNLRGGDGPSAIVPGAGSGRGNRPVASGHPGPIHTGDPTGGPNLAGKTGRPGDGPGTPGLDGVVTGGPGKSHGFQTTTRPGGPANGFENGKGLDGIKPSSGDPVVANGTPSGTPKGPLKSSVNVSGSQDAGSGSAVNAVYKDPSASSITVPDSLLGTPYDATVTVRVVLQANGEAQVEITHPSAYPALDAQVKALCSRIRFKPAMLDGKAVDETHTFNFHLHNGS